jgi:aspartate racemase
MQQWKQATKMEMIRDRKIIGILGGMGAEATVELFKRIVEKTQAKSDQDHLRIIIDNNPQIPDRTQAILHNGKDPLPLLRKSASILEAAGADFIIIPCNSAHYFLENIREAVTIPILNMIGETTNAITEKRVGLLATDGTAQIGLYHKACSERGIEIISPKACDQQRVMGVIYGVKAGKRKQPFKETVIDVIHGLKESGIEALILGCTELSVLFTEEAADLPMYDALDILAKSAVREALEERKLPTRLDG